MVTQGDVEKAILCSDNSAPGPDGIPYMAWRKAGRLAVAIIHGALHQIQKDNFKVEYLPMDFNTSFLCCLPKKPSGHDSIVGDFYAPKATRPLSLVNTDNRLMASAARIRVEPTMEAVISDMQRGFLRGRKMIRNVLDVDLRSMKIALKAERGALVLFDFEDAFPSISQEYLLSMLDALGVPSSFTQLVKAFYHDCRCILKVVGTTAPGFPMTSGVRQGCPLSPLLFVLVADILLRRLQKCVNGDNVIRAFADDVAMIVEDSIRHFDTAVDIYKQFGSFFGLNLNWSKTIVIPLWEDSIEQAKKELNSACPDSAAMDFSAWGTYLGFAVGPDRNRHIWTKAKDKFATRAIVWKESHQGLHFAATTYNVFVNHHPFLHLATRTRGPGFTR